jgi:hypothetical protein
MNNLHRPGLTLWHTFVACALVAMATTLTVPEEGYSEEARRHHDALLPAEPVVLRKGEFVIYDSGVTVADLWNIESEAEAREVLKLLDKKQYAKDVAAGRL